MNQKNLEDPVWTKYLLENPQCSVKVNFPKFDIILIHGTWAKNAAWTKFNSLIRTRLESIFPNATHFNNFDWSGSNTELARESAAAKLTTELGNTAEVHERPTFIIGHSHAGNIIAQALAANNSSEFVSKIQGIICLGTPFFFKTARSMSTMMIHLALLFLGTGLVADYVTGLIFPTAYAVRMIISGLVSLVPIAVMLIAPLVAKPFMKEVVALGRNYRLRTSPIYKPPVCCVSHSDDEAFQWLQGVETVANLPYLLLNIYVFIPLLFVVMGAHYLFDWEYYFLAIDGWQSLDQSLDKERVAFNLEQDSGTWIGVLLFILSALTYYLLFWGLIAWSALLLGLALHGFAFGTGFTFKSLVGTLVSRTNISLTPIQYANCTFNLVESAKFRGLKHSLVYGDPKTVDLISSWIETQMASQFQSTQTEHPNRAP